MDELREWRRQKGWSQKDLARESKVGPDTISGIESGRHEARPSTLRKLASALDVEVADLLRGPQTPKVNAPRSFRPERTADEERRTLELVRATLSDLNLIASRLEAVAVARTFDADEWRQADAGLDDAVSSLYGKLWKLRDQGVNVATGHLADEVEETMNRLVLAQLASIEAARQASPNATEEEWIHEDELEEQIPKDELEKKRQRKAVVQAGLDELTEKATRNSA